MQRNPSSRRPPVQRQTQPQRKLVAAAKARRFEPKKITKRALPR